MFWGLSGMGLCVSCCVIGEPCIFFAGGVGFLNSDCEVGFWGELTVLDYYEFVIPLIIKFSFTDPRKKEREGG